MAPSYELIYFNARGRAEVARYLFAMAGVQYKDTRYSQEDWGKNKATTKTHQLPILIVDNKTIIPSSGAIERYLAKTFKFCGKNAIEEAKIDSLICCVSDVTSALMLLKYGGLPENLAKEKGAKFCTETLPTWLAYFEGELNANGYFFDSLTVGELSVDLALNWTSAMCPLDCAKFPKLAKMQDNIKKHPKICEWMKKRPVTDM